MTVYQQARCPYCGEMWDLDVGSQDLTDEQFLEVTKEPVAYIPCESCTYLQYD